MFWRYRAYDSNGTLHQWVALGNTHLEIIFCLRQAGLQAYDVTKISRSDYNIEKLLGKQWLGRINLATETTTPKRTRTFARLTVILIVGALITLLVYNSCLN